MKRIILVIMCLSLISTTVLSCGSGPRNREAIKEYLTATQVVIGRASDISTKVSNLYQNSSHLQPSEIVNQCTLYEKEYNKLLGEFTVLESPQECLKLREYVIDALTYSAKELLEYGAAHSTMNSEHLYKSQSYYHDAQRAISLAAAEWDRIKKEFNL